MLEFEVETCFCIWSWWRPLAEGGNLKFYSCRGCWGGRSCPRSVTTIHSVAVDRTPNLPIERGRSWAIATQPVLRFSLKYFVLLCEWALIRGVYAGCATRVAHTQSKWSCDFFQVVWSWENHKKAWKIVMDVLVDFLSHISKPPHFKLVGLADFVMHYYFPVSFFDVATLGVRWHSRTPFSVIGASASARTRSSFINWQFGWIEHNGSNKSYLFCSASSYIFNSYIT